MCIAFLPQVFISHSQLPCLTTSSFRFFFVLGWVLAFLQSLDPSVFARPFPSHRIPHPNPRIPHFYRKTVGCPALLFSFLQVTFCIFPSLFVSSGNPVGNHFHYPNRTQHPCKHLAPIFSRPQNFFQFNALSLTEPSARVSVPGINCLCLCFTSRNSDEILVRCFSSPALVSRLH